MGMYCTKCQGQMDCIGDVCAMCKRAPDTHLLDGAIKLLNGDNPGVKRAKRTAQVEMSLTVQLGHYTITSNGKVVEDAEGDPDYAKDRLAARAAAVRKLGKTVSTVVWGKQ